MSRIGNLTRLIHTLAIRVTIHGCQSCSWSAEQGKLIFPCPRSRLRTWSRETGSAASCSTSAYLLITVLRLNLVLTHGIPPDFRGGGHLLFTPPYAIGLFPSLSGHAIAYRWRSLPRVHRHRASNHQGSSSNGCCLCSTMDLSTCASSFPHPLHESIGIEAYRP